MQEKSDVPLSSLTSLRTGGVARRLVVAESEAEIIDVTRAADRERTTLLVLGGGSNVVIGDEPFAGTVMKIGSRGVAPLDSGGRAHANEVRWDVEAGEPWDDLVSRAVSEKLAGVECLAGIPGLVGAVPMQNVGAYGQDVSAVIEHVRAFDREHGREVEIPAGACAFGYRKSMFRGSSRYVITRVRLRLRRAEEARVPAYAELLRALSIEDGGRAPLALIRDTVLALRRGKGMVLDAGDPESVSAGSFFTNPVVTEEVAVAAASRAGLAPNEKMPRFADATAAPGMVKLSAAWLIERAGFPKGTTRGQVGTSRKHALALVNRGGTARELLALAAEIRDGVHARFGVILEPEPVIVGAAFPSPRAP